PVSGIPITVSRTYDTLQAATSRDFGFGWRLEFRNIDLRTSVVPTGLESVGLYNPFRDGTRGYVTPPGGRREGFTFRPQGRNLLGLVTYSPAFVPDPGVTSQLMVPFFTLLRQGNEYFGFTIGGLPYNPADPSFGGRYTLTTKEGLAYEIEPNSGNLLNVTDPNSNRLTFSDAGIDSSTGQRITFGRDPQGRIASVTDPAGGQIGYQYDDQGNLVAVTDRQSNTTR